MMLKMIGLYATLWCVISREKKTMVADWNEGENLQIWSWKMKLHDTLCNEYDDSYKDRGKCMRIFHHARFLAIIHCDDMLFIIFHLQSCFLYPLSRARQITLPIAGMAFECETFSSWFELFFFFALFLQKNQMKENVSDGVTPDETMKRELHSKILTMLEFLAWAKKRRFHFYFIYFV